MYKFSEEEIKDIVESYLNGESSVKIAKRYDVKCHKTILKLLHKNNIDVNKRNSRIYKINSNYFDIIDTETKAYCLGFLYADGCNYIKKGTVSMSLQEEDSYILELLRKDMNNEHPLEFIDYSNKHDGGYNYKNQYRMLMFDTHICNRLNEIGMVPAKSLILEFPDEKFIPRELWRHFIRGYFDGDGCININGTINILSTKNFVSKINDIFLNEIFIENSGNIRLAKKNNDITCSILFRKNDSKKILDWFYTDSKIYLKRKYDRYINAFYLNNSLIA